MPQSARLSAGRGVQWLFGQCPNELLYFYGGASLIMIMMIIVRFGMRISPLLSKLFSMQNWERDLGKPQHKNIAVHLGIAQIAIGPPPHSNHRLPRVKLGHTWDNSCNMTKPMHHGKTHAAWVLPCHDLSHDGIAKPMQFLSNYGMTFAIPSPVALVAGMHYFW